MTDKNKEPIPTKASHDQLAREAEEWKTGVRSPKGYSDAPEAIPRNTESVQELKARLAHLASGFRKGGWEKPAEMLEGIIALSSTGTPLVTLLAQERDRAVEANKKLTKTLEEIKDWLDSPQTVGLYRASGNPAARLDRISVLDDIDACLLVTQEESKEPEKS